MENIMVDLSVDEWTQEEFLRNKRSLENQGIRVVLIDTILNQKTTGVHCIYVAIGQKLSSVVAVQETLEKHGAMEYTTIVCASSEFSPEG